MTKKLKNFSFLLHHRLAHFIFNSKFFNQIDGAAMGSPLAPALANILMVFYESMWHNEYNLNKAKIYLRCVDDILAAFDNEQDPLFFLNSLNNRHANIKFTIKKQIKHSIAFFDVLISIINNQIIKISHFKHITN